MAIFLPRRVIHVDALPRQETGKITAQALREFALRTPGDYEIGYRHVAPPLAAEGNAGAPVRSRRMVKAPPCPGAARSGLTFANRELLRRASARDDPSRTASRSRAATSLRR